MKKFIVVLLSCCCAVVLANLIATSQVRVNHQHSSAFNAALVSAVDRLENGARAAAGATAVMMNATAPGANAQVGGPTFNGRYTCETYQGPNQPRCNGTEHTVESFRYTCNTAPGATCQTYDVSQFTCDPNRPDCGGAHTTEPPPYNHTCQAVTCDGSHTCDFTVDPRALTCDRGNECSEVTLNSNHLTCDPTRPQCRGKNPLACTIQAGCTSDGAATCDPVAPGCGPYTTDPRSATCDPAYCQPATYDGRYTCETYQGPGQPRCTGVNHTIDPQAYTCNSACQTYDSGQPTCDTNMLVCRPTYDPAVITCDASRMTCDGVSPNCHPGHTTEPPPYNHTCDSQTCDKGFTCDLTADARAFTCDAANPQCQNPTYNAFMATCNPLQIGCRSNNPGACTSQFYLTCQRGNPSCPSVGVEGTTWGKVKEKFKN